jgi:hypothetical protein
MTLKMTATVAKQCLHWLLGLIRISHTLLLCCPRSQGKYILEAVAAIFADDSAVIFVSENEG